MSYLTQQEVGERLAELRAARDLSQRDLAEAIGLDPSALSRIESGERGLGVGELVATADYLGMNTDQLLRTEQDAVPLFRTDGGSEEAEGAVALFASVIDDFFTFEAAARH